MSTAPESRGTPPNRVDGAVVDCAYEADGRRHTSSTWLPDRARVPGELHVCVDPDDPARHSVRTDPTVECGDGPLGSDAVRQAERVAS